MNFRMSGFKLLSLVGVALFLSYSAVALPFGLSSIFDKSSESTSKFEMPEGMKDELKSKSTTTYESMVKSLPENYSERKNLTVEYAREVCDFPNVGKYEKGIESSAGAQAFVRQLQNSIEVTNRYLSTGLQADDLAPVYGGTKKVAKYASSVDSYKTWRDRACNVSSNPTNETMEKFYRSTAVLTFEVILIQTSASYKVSSKATRMFNSGFGVARVRKYCGDECYSAALSLPHWGVRFSTEGFTDYILDISNREGVNLNRKDARKLAQDIDDQLPSDSDINQAMDKATSQATETAETLNDVSESINSEKSNSVIDVIIKFLFG